MTAIWVSGAPGWAWLILTLLTMSIGFALGWWARAALTREQDVMEEEARRAARIYHREVEAARRRHPSHG